MLGQKCGNMLGQDGNMLGQKCGNFLGQDGNMFGQSGFMLGHHMEICWAKFEIFWAKKWIYVRPAYGNILAQHDIFKSVFLANGKTAPINYQISN